MKIKKLLTLVLTVAMVISMLVIPASAAGLNDIGDHWAKASIQRWVDAGILKGYEDGSFRPNNPIKRAEFAHILVQTLGLTGAAEVEFADVADHWAKDSIYACAATGIVNGFEDKTFRPEVYITRLQAMKMFVSAMKMTGGFTEEEAKEFLTVEFTDGSEISWGHEFAATMVAYGAMQGSAGKLNPNANITRAEAAIILDRLLAAYVSKDGKISTTTQEQVDKGMMCNIVAVHPDASTKVRTGENGEITITVGETVVETATLNSWTPVVLCGTECDWAYNCEVNVDKGEMDQIYYWYHNLIEKEVNITYVVENEELVALTNTTEYFYDEETWQVVKVINDSYYRGEAITLTAEYDDDGNIVKVCENDVVVAEYIYEKGNLVQAVYTPIDGMEKQITYIYNDAGLLVEENATEGTMPLYKDVYEYDSNGNQTNYRHYIDESMNLAGDTVFTYDANGNLLSVERGEYRSSGDTIEIVYHKSVETYENGRMVSEKYIYSEDNVDETTYSYDENDRVVLSERFRNGELTEKVVYTYNEEGRRTSVAWYDEENVETSKEVFTFEEKENGYYEKTEYYEFGEMYSYHEWEDNWDTNESWSREYQNRIYEDENGEWISKLELVSEYYTIGEEVDGKYVETTDEWAEWGKWGGERVYVSVLLPENYERNDWYWEFLYY